MSCLIGGQNPCRASCFASVFLKQTVEFNRLFQIVQGKTASAARGSVELNQLFHIGRVATQLARQGFCTPIRHNDLFLVFEFNPSFMTCTNCNQFGGSMGLFLKNPYQTNLLESSYIFKYVTNLVTKQIHYLTKK